MRRDWQRQKRMCTRRAELNYGTTELSPELYLTLRCAGKGTFPTSAQHTSQLTCGIIEDPSRTRD